MLTMINSAILIICCVFIAHVEICAARRRRRERKRRSEDLRRENESIVAIRKCGAELVRIDRLAEMEMAPFVGYAWPKPVKEGDIFLACLETCKKAAACPVAKALQVKGRRHRLVAEDGFAIVKSRTIYADGSMVFHTEHDLEGQEIFIEGTVHRGEGNSRCYVRTNQPERLAAEADERGDGADHPGGPNDGVAQS